jgi:hypothetical protein
MKNNAAFKLAKIMAAAGYWDIAILYLRKAYGV